MKQQFDQMTPKKEMKKRYKKAMTFLIINETLRVRRNGKHKNCAVDGGVDSLKKMIWRVCTLNL